MSTEDKDLTQTETLLEAVADKEKEIENLTQEGDLKSEEVEKEPVEELSEFEKEQSQQGWTKKEIFEADPKNRGKSWKTAEQYEYDGRFFKKIDAQHRQIESANRELRELKNLVKELSQKQVNSLELDVKQNLARLENEKLAAVRESDVQKFQTIEAQMLREYQKLDNIKPSQSAAQPQLDYEAQSEVEEFTNRNRQWYNPSSQENQAMMVFAQTAETALKNTRPDLSIRDRLVLTEQQVKLAFPHKFENAKRQEPMAVSPRASTTAVGTRQHKDYTGQLSDEQKTIAKRLVEMGAFKSTNEYAKSLLGVKE